MKIISVLITMYFTHNFNQQGTQVKRESIQSVSRENIKQPPRRPNTYRTIPLKQQWKKDDKEGVDWINLAQDRDQQEEALGNIGMNSLTPQHMTACDLKYLNLCNQFTLCYTPLLLSIWQPVILSTLTCVINLHYVILIKSLESRGMRKNFKGFGS